MSSAAWTLEPCGRRREKPFTAWRSNFCGPQVSYRRQTGCSTCKFSPRAATSMHLSLRTTKYAGMWLGQAVATPGTGDGDRINGPCMVAQRGAALPGATMAPAATGLEHSAGWWSWGWGAEVRSDAGNRGERGVENACRVLMTSWLTPLRRLARGPETLSVAVGYATTRSPETLSAATGYTTRF